LITLITGVPGAGKTLRTMELMDKFVQEGRPVWTNIDGCTLPGVMLLPKDWGGHWQDYDDGSVFVIDEVQLIWRASGKTGLTQNEDIQELEKHRHRGMDFILTTQHPTFVETHVRKLVGKHEHLNRPRGSRVIGISDMDHYFDIQDPKAVRSADFHTWVHPKKYFKYYNSATIHTHGFKVPKKLLIAFGSIAVLGTVGAYMLSQSIIFGNNDNQIAAIEPMIKIPAATNTKLVYHDQDWASLPVKTSVAGCISNETRCACYDPSGHPLQLDTNECHKRMEQILPTSLLNSTGSENAQRSRPGGNTTEPHFPELF